jgi:hypothetical protein
VFQLASGFVSSRNGEVMTPRRRRRATSMWPRS